MCSVSLSRSHYFLHGLPKRCGKYDRVAAVAFADEVVQAFMGIAGEVADNCQAPAVIHYFLQDLTRQSGAKIEERLVQRFLVNDNGVGGQVHHNFEKILCSLDRRSVLRYFGDELALDDVQYGVHEFV